MRAIKYIYIVGMFAVLTFVSCHGPAEQKAVTSQELRELYKEVLTAAISNPDSAMMMIERLRVGAPAGISFKQHGAVPDYQTDLMRAKIYSQSLEGTRLDSAIIIGERLMTLDVAKTDLDYRQDVLEMLIRACRAYHDDEQIIHWTTLMIDLCRQQEKKQQTDKVYSDMETEVLRYKTDIGLTYANLGKAEEGLALIDSVITELSGKRKFNEMDASVIALKRKVNVLKTVERYSEIPQAAKVMLDLMADYEQHPDEFHDGSYREIPENLRPGYIDFYRSQAYVFMAEAYANIGDMSSARHYLDLFEHGDLCKTLEGREEIAPTLCLLGEYDKMEAIYGEVAAGLREQGDTVNNEYATLLRYRAKAAEAQGRKDEALRLLHQYEEVNDALQERLLRGKAHLYAARYHAHEQQQEIEQQKTARRYVFIVALCIGIAALVAMLFAAYAIRQRRREHQKNRVLAEQIAETLDYKKMYMYMELRASPSPIPADAPTRLSGEQDAKEASADPASLFRYLSDVIIHERLYLDPAIGRQMLSDRFHLSDHLIGTAFAQGSSYKSLPEFIRTLRLEHACGLLRERPDMTISEVATASGFSNLNVFSRYFKAKYMMTPTDFRQLN